MRLRVHAFRKLCSVHSDILQYNIYFENIGIVFITKKFQVSLSQKSFLPFEKVETEGKKCSKTQIQDRLSSVHLKQSRKKLVWDPPWNWQEQNGNGDKFIAKMCELRHDIPTHICVFCILFPFYLLGTKIFNS